MDLEKKQPATTRRRGNDLESALLAAAWQQLTETGYGGFTFDAIAKRAQTSKPVLYRRWPTRESLLAATLSWRGEHDRLEVPDTGSLRADVLTLLRAANRRPERFLAMLSAHVGGLYGGAGITPAELRQQYIGSGPSAMSSIIERAITRGEIRPERATPRIVSVPFDLLRMQVFLTLGPLPDADIVSIVDEVFLPLIEHASTE